MTASGDSRERILAKIRKLQALAQSDNEGEAGTAAARAAELLAKHQIDEAELGVASIVVEEGISDRRGPRPLDWEAQLVRGIGAGTGAHVYFEQRGPRGRVTEGQWKAIGTTDQCATARYLLQMLRREITRLSDREYDRAFPIVMCRETQSLVPCTFLSGQLRCLRCRRPKQVRGDARGWKAQWRLGCAVRVSIRLARSRRETMAAAAAAARAGEDAAPSSEALVRVDQTQREVDRVASTYTFTRGPAPDLDREHIDALIRGSAAGEQIPLSASGALSSAPDQLEDRKRTR